ncbi:hypothetical protein P171DRAFT_508886 [Karstenula rhodostoma CBS 690.94]|uniref:Uncharacterized protein n=1 Tax=Karstenula rhodostoma CBS 690.94 TaxID=1392251 RepID=A0A9P4PP04_9PLEO|nr:hypothetical protein P171DRAFT_508886 [Karstenula rhodostoma CBS 690.94]
MPPWHSHRKSLYESVDVLPTLSTTVTVTRTVVRWVEPSSTLKRVASRARRPAQIDLPLASQVAGGGDVSLVEPAQTTSQPGNEAAASPTLSLTSSPALLEDTTLAHIAPEPGNPAYPLTLYDRLAEAPTTYTAIREYDYTPSISSNSMEGGDFELPDIPPSAQFALLAFLGAGVLWSVLVWVINLPLTRPKSNVQERAPREKGNTGTKVWWKCRWGRQHIPRQTPVDEPQTYAPLASGSSAGTTSSTEGIPTTATTSATPERAANAPIRLRKLASATKRQPPPSPSLPPWQSPTPPRNITPATHNHPQYNNSSTTPSSPANPFLPHSLQSRSSFEYLAAHHAFFSKPLSTPPLPQSSPHLPPYPSRSASPVSDLDALEAQSDSIVEPRRSRSTRSVMHIADGVEKTAGEFWTGGWIGVVEEGVNKAVDAVVRWTEEEDGEEGLLLPIGRREV